MLSVTAPSFTDPSRYELSTLPRPSVTEADHVVIRVHAASINPVDVKKAAGAFKMILKEQFPYKIGYDASGVVESIGDHVTRFNVGDEVFVRLPEASRGSWSEFAKCKESFIALKPKTLSFEEAAAIPLAGITAFQALQQYKGSLQGKTVLVPAGLSGTGSYACQLAKNVFRAGKVITTVSPSKVAKVPECLGEGVVDQIIDYTKDDPAKVIPRGSVDFLFDTTGNAMTYLHLMTPSTGTTITVSLTPSPETMQRSTVMQRPDNPRIPLIPYVLLRAMDSVRKLRARRWGVSYEYWFLKPNGADLEELASYVDQGKLRPVIGKKVNIRDIEDVKKACMVAYTGKGGIGKSVIEIA